MQALQGVVGHAPGLGGLLTHLVRLAGAAPTRGGDRRAVQHLGDHTLTHGALEVESDRLLRHHDRLIGWPPARAHPFSNSLLRGNLRPW